MFSLCHRGADSSAHVQTQLFKPGGSTSTCGSYSQAQHWLACIKACTHTHRDVHTICHLLSLCLPTFAHPSFVLACLSFPSKSRSLFPVHLLFLLFLFYPSFTEYFYQGNQTHLSVCSDTNAPGPPLIQTGVCPIWFVSGLSNMGQV